METPITSKTTVDLTSATEILCEIGKQRRFHIDSGHTPAEDDRLNEIQLIAAAQCYTSAAALKLNPQNDGMTVTSIQSHLINAWPFPNGWIPKDSPRTNLIYAAALIVAEIERLDRNNPPKPKA